MTLVKSRVALEVVDKALDLLDNFLKEWYYWNARRDSSKRSEQYSKTEISVHYHFRVLPGYLGNPQAQEFCARFNPLPRNQLRSDFCTAINRGQVGSAHPGIDRRKGYGQVFIDDVDIIDYPKRGAVRLVPSEVWLRPSDACLLYSFSEVMEMFGDRSLEPTPFGHNREIELLTIEDSRTAMVRNLPEQLVKRGTELMRYFSDDDAPFLWDIGQDCVRNEDELSKTGCPVHATLTDIFTRVLLPESVSPFLEGFQVIDCPIDLELRAIQRMHEMHSHLANSSHANSNRWKPIPASQ